MKSLLILIHFFATLWRCISWKPIIIVGFLHKNTGMHHHFILQIVQSRCSCSDGLCNHSHIPALHTVYSHAGTWAVQKSLSQMMSFMEDSWKSQRLESQDLPTTHCSSAQGTLPGFHSITLRSRFTPTCTTVPRAPSRALLDPPETLRDSTGFGVLSPRISPLE